MTPPEDEKLGLLAASERRRSLPLLLRYLRDGQWGPHIGAMHLDLTDEETAALIQELHDTVESDRYPFSPRIRTLRAVLAKLRPEPVREPC